MIDGQFNLDGYTFGHPSDPCVLLTDGWDTGEYEIRDQDVPMPFSDTVAFGRDQLTPPTWTFTMGVRDLHGGQVYPHLRALAARWRADSIRTTPGAVSTLRYRRDGEERIVYGRPRKFAVEKDAIHDGEWKLVTATFQLSDVLTYSTTEQSVTLDLVNTSTATGLVFPTSFPWTFSRTTNTREGVVVIDTDMPTPFEVLIRGPVTGSASNFKLRSTTGWSMTFPTTLSARGNIRVDTRRGIATRNSVPFGTAGSLTSFRSLLQPGSQELSFSCDDPSFTSSATISWRDVSPIV